MTAKQVIAALKLVPHPLTGGYIRETYRSDGILPQTVLPWNAGPRPLGTAIYYLLTPDSVEGMHRLPTDEIFHFYLGDPVQMLQLWPDGESRTVILGHDVLHNQHPQTVVPGGVWQGSFLMPKGKFALLGATMAPGYAEEDYTPGDREELTRIWPAEAALIRKLTPMSC